MAIYDTKLERIQHRHSKRQGSYTLLDPVKHRTDTRGYWTDDTGKVYRDNFVNKVYHSWEVVKGQAVKLCKDKSQLCIFVKGQWAGYIIDSKGKVTIYRGKRIIPLQNIRAIRQAIRQYKSGITIYKDIKGYRAEDYI